MPRISNKYWIIHEEIKIPFNDFYKEPKETLTIFEAKLIWYLRHSNPETVSKFFRLAMKCFDLRYSEKKLEKIA